MSRRRLYELRYRLRIDIWKTSNLGRLVSLFSHLRNEKLPSDNVCVCVPIFFIIFSSHVKLVFDIPIVSTAYLIFPLHRLPGHIPIPSLSPSFSRCLQRQTAPRCNWTGPRPARKTWTSAFEALILQERRWHRCACPRRTVLAAGKGAIEGYNYNMIHW